MLLLGAVGFLAQAPEAWHDRWGGKREAVARRGGGSDTEDAVLAGLKWLARHQAADGAWDPRGCDKACGAPAKYAGARCAPDMPAPAAPRAERPLTEDEKNRFAALVEALSSDDLDERDRAVPELTDLGARDFDRLQNAHADQKNPEVAARLKDIIDIVRSRTEDRGTEVVLATALALQAFLGAGYTQVSMDIHDGISFGDIVRRGLEALRARQLEDGFVGAARGSPRAVLAHALATHVLCENTAAVRAQREAAQKATQALLGRQLNDGGWSATWTGTARDPLATAAAAWAVEAAGTAQIEGSDAALRALVRVGSGEPGQDRAELAMLGTALVLGDRRPSAELRRVVASVGTAPDENPLLAVLLSQVVFQSDEARWKEWNDAAKKSLGTQDAGRGNAPCLRGSWSGDPKTGRLMTTACRVLLFETYYRFRPHAR